MTNKYAEGYPGKRYYGGCQFVDIAETWRSSAPRSCSACNFANVQPNSGSQMNQAVFLALLQPGDTFMGLDLNSGGHLTHGSPVNMSRQVVQRRLLRRAPGRPPARHGRHREAGAREHKPKLILAGGTAYSRIWDWKRFREIADCGRRLSDGRHGPYRRPRGRRRASVAGAARPCRDHDHAQVAARPARRHDPDQRRGRSPRRSIRPSSRACRAAR